MPQNPLQALAQDVLRRLGMENRPEKIIPRFNTSVNVFADMPNNNVPFPKNIDEIVLGGRHNPPTGTYIDTSRKTLDVSRNLHNNFDPTKRDLLFKKERISQGRFEPLQEAYKMLLELYPYAQYIPKGIFPDSTLGNNEGAYNGLTDELTLNPDLSKKAVPAYIASTIAHELTHNSQRNNYLDKNKYTDDWGWTRLVPYEYSPIEAAPRAVGDNVFQKLVTYNANKKMREGNGY